jgi:hypothetical protein
MLYGCLFTLCGAGLLGLTFWLFERATADKRILPTGAISGESALASPPSALRKRSRSRHSTCTRCWSSPASRWR